MTTPVKRNDWSPVLLDIDKMLSDAPAANVIFDYVNVGVHYIREYRHYLSPYLSRH